MRIYIIGNDGITLCREPPAIVNEGEIAVASNEELHAAPLSGKRAISVNNAEIGASFRSPCSTSPAELRSASFMSLAVIGEPFWKPAAFRLSIASAGGTLKSQLISAS
jgi:hypothetical protein